VLEERVMPNAGKFALFAGPEGRVLGIWHPGMKRRSPEKVMGTSGR